MEILNLTIELTDDQCEAIAANILETCPDVYSYIFQTGYAQGSNQTEAMEQEREAAMAEAERLENAEQEWHDALKNTENIPDALQKLALNYGIDIIGF